MNKIVLNPSFSTFALDGMFFLFNGSRQMTVEKSMYQSILKLSKFCLDIRQEDDIYSFMEENNIHTSTLTLMLDNRMLVNSFINLEDSFSRSDLYLEYVGVDSSVFRELIYDKNILIIGCGGIGNAVTFALSSFGYRNFYLLDGDVVEVSNLNRQFLFTRKDIGKNKVDILKRELKTRFRDMNIEALPRSFVDSDVKMDWKIDLVVVSGDSDGILEEVTRFSLRKETPMISVGYLCDIACIGPFYIPGVSSCPLCSNIYGDKEKNTLSKEVNLHFKAPSAFPNNFLASSMAVNDINMYFSRNVGKIRSLNKRYGVNSQDFERHEIACQKNEACVCAHSTHGELTTV